MNKTILFLGLLLINLNLNATNITKSRTFLCPKSTKVNVRNGPSSEFIVKFVIVKSGYPLEATKKVYDWFLVKDYQNREGWVQESLLKSKCKVILTQDQDLNKLIGGKKVSIGNFKQGSLFDVQKCTKNICSLQYNNQKGWIEKKFLWGLD